MDRKRTVRISKAFISVFLLLCIAGVAALRIHAERVRWKAEQLQAEVLKLTPGVTTLAEVRAFVSKAERPEGYAGFSGPQCDKSECVVSIGPMAFIEGWRYPIFRRLGFLGIRPASYDAMVTVQDGIVREVIASTFYSTGPRRISSASVILVEQFNHADLANTPVIDGEHGIALCSGANDESGISSNYAMVALQPNSIQREFHSICHASLPLADALKPGSFSMPKIRRNTARSLCDRMRRAFQKDSGSSVELGKGNNCR